MSKRSSYFGEPPAKEARGEEFLCPLTKRLPIDPVTAEDGNTYERAAITEYLKDKTTSPVDGTPMAASLRPNNMVRKAIERLMETASAEERDQYLAEVKAHTMSRAKALFDEGKVLEAAELGLPEACSNMARLCYYGRDGVTQDYVQAMAWARKAPYLWTSVGIMFFCYYDGYGTEKNWRAAVDLIESESLQLPLYFTACVGQLYRIGGHGIPRDYEKALHYYSKSSCATATFGLGVMHQHGLGVPQNYLLAKEWYNKNRCSSSLKRLQELNESAQKLFEEGKVLEAAKMGLAKAQGALAEQYYYGDGVPQSYPNAFTWAQLAAEDGDHDGQLYVALAYENGHGTEKNWTLAVKMYTAYMDSGHYGGADMWYKIGDMYYQGGFGLAQDFEEAMKWFTRIYVGYSDIHINAVLKLGRMYRQGLGVAKDWKKAATMFEKVKLYDDISSQLLGCMYSTGGHGLEKNLELAARSFQFGSDRGNMECMLCYADFLLTGNGVSKNEKEARRLFETVSKDSADETIKAMATRKVAVLVIKGQGGGTGGDLVMGYRLLQSVAETDAEARAIVERMHAC
jgi:TPR repeat protein